VTVEVRQSAKVSLVDWLLWAVLPYCAGASFVLGHMWVCHRGVWPGSARPRPDRLERVGFGLFRAAVMMVITARVGQLVLWSTTDSAWPFEAVELTGLAFGVAAALIMAAPLVTAGRRPTTPFDRATLPLLAVVMLTGTAIMFDPTLANADKTEDTLYAWARSLVRMHPDPAAMVHAPFLYQVRGMAVLILVAIWPYTRLAAVFVPRRKLAGRSAV
jgi:nitrate reductase gamma subunit